MTAGGGVETMRVHRQRSPLVASLAQNWQLLLVASLPGSILRIWAVLNRSNLEAWAHAPGARESSLLVTLALWSGDHVFLTLLTFPLLAIAASLAYDRYGERPGRAGRAAQRACNSATTSSPLTVDRLSAGARELLCAASFGGTLRLERRRTGPAVVVTAASDARDDSVCEFHNDADPGVAQRYRAALAELEQAGLLARGPDGFRPTAIGSTAAKFLNRQELDRIAARARHLDKSELALLRIVAECQQRYNARKIALHRDGTRVCTIFSNGETVVVPGLTLLAITDGSSDAAATSRPFEQLVQGIPSCYLAPLPGRLLRNPFLVRVTDIGLRYLRHAEVIDRDRAAA